VRHLGSLVERVDQEQVYPIVLDIASVPSCTCCEKREARAALYSEALREEANVLKVVEYQKGHKSLAWLQLEDVLSF
jgi:hypothetical protein